MYKIILFLILWLSSPYLLFSQNGGQDKVIKLHKELSKSKDGIKKIDRTLDLAFYHIELSRDLSFPRSADSAVYFIKKALNMSQKIKYQAGIGDSYNGLAQIYNIKKAYDESEKYAQMAIATYSKTKDKSGLGDSYRMLMYSKEDVRDFKETVLIGQKARKAYMEAGNKNMQARIDEDIAYFMISDGKLEEAIKLLEECISLYKQVKYGGVQYIYSTLCIVYNQLGRNEKAIEYAQKAVSTAEKNNDTGQRATEVYNYAGIVYLTIKERQKALEYFKKAYVNSKKYNDTGMTSLLLTNMIEILLKTKKDSEAKVYLKELEKNFDKLSPVDQFEPMSSLMKAYVRFKEFDHAGKYIQKAMTASNAMEVEDMRQLSLYTGIIDYNFAVKKYDLARDYANRYKKLSENIKSPKRLMEVHHMLFKIDSAENKFSSAMKNYKMENVYKDSLLNEAKNKEIAALEVKYETNKKEKELKQNKEKNRLLSLESNLQKSKLSKANLTKNIFLAGFLLFIVIFILLYYNYRIKQKTNRVLESQKNEINQKNTTLQKLVTEKEWLLKEIHHRVKNNLQMVMSLLNAQSYYLKDDVAMTAIRESQHRIHSMSLIHKKLYQSDNVTAIDMRNYIQELVEYFKTSFETGSRVQFVMDVEPIELYTSQAVPIGLILNETITNSIKHAFTNKSNGIISIFFKHSHNKHLQLSVKDNGAGISDDLEEKRNDSLGMKLIKGFSEDLDAKLLFENNNGLIITIEFEYDTTFTGDIHPT